MLAAYLTRGRVRELVAAGVFSSLALLTRYVGISVVIAAVVVILLWGSRGRTSRLRAAGVVLGAGLLPSIAWALYNSTVQHGDAPRSFTVHIKSFAGAFDVMEAWLVPASWPSV